MKTVKIEGKAFDISAPEIRAIKLLKQHGFVANKTTFWERVSRNRKCLIGENHARNKTIGIDVNFISSVKYFENHGLVIHGRIQDFLRKNPRARQIVNGNPSRINSILKQIETTKG